MAIGVRITSNNLSGKTANVTFLPTSGGTVDLGTTTIPFNNITTYPYGVYEIYVPEYDYTYTLEIPENYVQSLIVLGKLSGDTSQWAVAGLEFGDFTASVINLGENDTDYFDIWDIYPMNEKGYLYVLMGGSYPWDNCSNTRFKLYFVNSSNVIIDTLELQNACVDWSPYANLDGYIIYGIDYLNGILKYFDGEEVFTFNWDSTTYPNFDILWNWGPVSKYKTFGVIIYDDVNTARVYLLNKGNAIFIEEYNTNDYGKDFDFNDSSSYFVEVTYDLNLSKFESVLVRSAIDGSVIQTLDLTSDYVLKNYTTTFFGPENFTFVFYNGVDSNIPYYIVNYDGATDTLTTNTHNKSNYDGVYLQTQNNFWPTDIGSFSLYMIFFTTGSYDQKLGYSVSYCDIVYRYSGSTNLTTYTFQDTGNLDEKYIYIDGTAGLNFFTHCGIGDGNISALAITATGATITPVTPYNDTYGSTDYYLFGNRYIQGNYTSIGYDQYKMTLFDENGQMLDSITQDLAYNYNKSIWTRYGLFLFNTDFDGGVMYYVNDSVSAFTSMDFYSSVGYTNNYWKSENNFSSSNFVLVNTETFQSQVLTQSTLHPSITLPSNNEYWYIQIGKNRVMYIYGDADDDTTHIKLYDFNFNIVNQIHTDYDSLFEWYQTDVLKDRYVVWFERDSLFKLYLISDSTITATQISDTTTSYSINDYIWWD